MTPSTLRHSLSVTEEKTICFPLAPQTTGIHYVSSFSVRPFIFRCLETSGRACVLCPPWLDECVLMAVSGDALCIVLGRVACQLSRTALDVDFLLGPPCFRRCYERSLWGLWQPRQTRTLISLDHKLWAYVVRGGWVYNDITVRIHPSPDVGHPNTAGLGSYVSDS